jgi:hydrogenase maturation protease
MKLEPEPGPAAVALRSGSGRILVIGIGRPQCGDDAAGLLAVTRLRERAGCAARVVCAAGTAWDLLDALEDEDLLIIVDAAEPHEQCPPGRWLRFFYPADADFLVTCRFAGTHVEGLADVLALAGALGRLPPETWIYALAGLQFVPETDLSTPVVAVLPLLIEALEADTRRWQADRGKPSSREMSCDRHDPVAGSAF